MSARPPFPKRIVLVGFMASGKSTVGRLLASALGWTYVDVDSEIERTTGTSIPEWFESREEAFRNIESRVAQDVLQETDIIVATGGGWASVHGNLDGLPSRTAVVWLEVTAEEAVARAERSGTPRPLLEVADPVARASQLLEARIPHYRRSDIRIDTVRVGPEEVTAQILRRLGRENHNS